MIHLIDDQALGAIMRGATPTPPEVDLYTTGCWYLRLCQAVAGADRRAGTLSRPFVDLPDDLRHRAVQRVLDLPEHVGLVSLRVLAPRMGQLRQVHDLNLLSLEVLAAAIELDGVVVLSARSPRLETALRAEGRPVVAAA